MEPRTSRPSRSMTLIEAARLTKQYRGHAAVKDVSFKIPSGSITGLLGPNGAGKSTTMRMLVGSLTPDGGAASIAGLDVATQTAQARRRLGYLPEAAVGFHNLTVLELLLFAAQCRGLNGEPLHLAVASVTGTVDLGPILSSPLSALSKGQRQRAWLAQAIIHDPPVLILDEPTDGLDPNQKASLRELLRSMTPRKAILMSTHILEEAEELCDRLIVMCEGSVVADSPTSDLLDDAGRLKPAFERLTLPPAGRTQ